MQGLFGTTPIRIVVRGMVRENSVYARDGTDIVGGRITELRQLRHFTSGRINYGIASNCRKNYMP